MPNNYILVWQSSSFHCVIGQQTGKLTSSYLYNIMNLVWKVFISKRLCFKTFCFCKWCNSAFCDEVWQKGFIGNASLWRHRKWLWQKYNGPCHLRKIGIFWPISKLKSFPIFHRRFVSATDGHWRGYAFQPSLTFVGNARRRNTWKVLHLCRHRPRP